MTKMKTIIIIVKIFEEVTNFPIKQFMRNIDLTFLETNTYQQLLASGSPHNILTTAFKWNETEEGHTFWSNWFNHLFYFHNINPRKTLTNYKLRK